MQVVTGIFHVTKDIAKILERGAQVLKSVLQMIFAYDHADIQRKASQEDYESSSTGLLPLAIVIAAFGEYPIVAAGSVVLCKKATACRLRSRLWPNRRATSVLEFADIAAAKNFY
jgi:hypothetical protein